MCASISNGRWTMRRDAAETVADDAEGVVATWNVRTPYLRTWFQRTGRAMHMNDDAVVQVSFDEECGLVTFDAGVGVRLVFGSGVFVGIAYPHAGSASVSAVAIAEGVP